MKTHLRYIKDRISEDTGAALVTVIMLVSIMSTMAVVAFETLDFSIRRTARVEQLQQARFYALGGEEIARGFAEKIYKTELLARHFSTLGGKQEISYPIEGGSIKGVLSDASNCFNINSLSAPPAGSDASEVNVYGQYVALLQAVGIGEGEALRLAASLADWIDADVRPRAGGAEDYDYGALDEPYRAANTLMADVNELYLVKGYDAETVEALKPFLCVRPDASPSVLHLNSLQPYEAPLLVAITAGIISTYDAGILISERPKGGYQNVADFWKERALRGRVIPQGIRQQVEVKPQAFQADIEVTYRDVTTVLSTTMLMAQGNESKLVNRRYGGKL